MSDTRDLNQRLKGAIGQEPVPPYLEARVRARMVERPAGRSWISVLIPAAAALVVGVVMTAYHFGSFRYTDASRASYISLVSDRVAPFIKIGLGQHIRCAVFRTYPKDPQPIETVERSLAPEYRGLVPIVERYVPDGFHLVMAHRCADDNRKFVHLTFSNGSSLISLLVTRKDQGEAFDEAGLLSAIAASGTPVYREGSQRFQVSAFQSPEYLVYFVSDLPANQNNAMMLSMAPQVQDFLKSLGS